MNDIKPTFVNRSLNTKNIPKTFDALKFIQEYLALSPNNIIKPNSLLYNVAISQYNETLKATMKRPPVPQWFCGKINAETGELLPLTDEERRVSAGFSTSPIEPTEPSATPDSGAYPEDPCLDPGTPGSKGYIACNPTGEDEITASDLSGINWQSSLGQKEAEADSLADIAGMGNNSTPFQGGPPETWESWGCGSTDNIIVYFTSPGLNGLPANQIHYWSVCATSGVVTRGPISSMWPSDLFVDGRVNPARNGQTVTYRHTDTAIQHSNTQTGHTGAACRQAYGNNLASLPTSPEIDWANGIWPNLLTSAQRADVARISPQVAAEYHPTIYGLYHREHGAGLVCRADYVG